MLRLWNRGSGGGGGVMRLAAAESVAKVLVGRQVGRGERSVGLLDQSGGRRRLLAHTRRATGKLSKRRDSTTMNCVL